MAGCHSLLSLVDAWLWQDAIASYHSLQLVDDVDSGVRLRLLGIGMAEVATDNLYLVVVGAEACALVAQTVEHNEVGILLLQLTLGVSQLMSCSDCSGAMKARVR